MKVTVGDVTNNKCNVREYLTCDEDGTIFVDLDALDTVLIDKSSEWDNLQRELADIKSLLPLDKHTLIKNIIGLNGKVRELEEILDQDHRQDVIESMYEDNERLKERVQELEQWAFETKPYIKSLEQQNKRYREVFDELRNFVLRGEDECNIKQLIMKRCNELEGEE